MKPLVFMKACKRCHGTLSLEQDQYGAYLVCIQCGAYTYPSTEISAQAVGTIKAIKISA